MTNPNDQRTRDEGVDNAFPRRLPPGLQALNELALDLRWTWSHASDRLWQAVDRWTWAVTRNPWFILQTISDLRLQHLARDKAFTAELDQLVKQRDEYLNAPGWYGQTHPERPLRTIAYFSMEYGISDVLPLYAGGLGILAGDFLKTASDMAVPMVGVGLLFQEGYFRQVLNAEGMQLETYPNNIPASLTVFPVRDASGAWLRVPVELPGRTLLLRIWRALVGRTSLYLLDSNDLLNSPADRGIAGRLYDAQPEMRLLQEMALGIGGWRALEAIGIDADVCHLNEGHTAFAGLERVGSLRRRMGLSFDEALWVGRAGTIFTTHTPVAAGFDRFAPALVARYCRGYAERLGISVEEFQRLGRINPRDENEAFNTAFLATRVSGAINAVSRLHGEVSRRLFAPLFPRWPVEEVPVGHITNGVHMPSWDSERADDLWTRNCGKERWSGAVAHLSDAIRAVSDEELWSMRSGARRSLVEHARERLARQLGQRGASADDIERARYVLDPNILTLGFARRFAGYKRPNLLLHDGPRFDRLLRGADNPVQLIVAGKAHPNDEEGKSYVQAFARFAQSPHERTRCVFLEDYDITLAQHFASGVDVWINTPRRPYEACGTSGMKVLVNGGLNLSEMDGWWAEAYSDEVGWAVGDGHEHREPEWDAYEAEQLYDLLERRVLPEFYDRDADGIPRAWVARIRASMARLTPAFSSNRMMQEYVENAYIPAASTLAGRSAAATLKSADFVTRRTELARNWGQIHFGGLDVTEDANERRVHVRVYLGDVNPTSVAVELYAEALDGGQPVRIPMRQGDPIVGATHGYLYEAAVPAQRPASDYTPRVVACRDDARIPVEDAHIIWYR